VLHNYLPIYVYLCVALGIGLVLLGLGFLIGKGQKYAEKLSPYECGFEPFEDSRMRFDVRYYLVAILFIVFDLEIAFFSPGQSPWRRPVSPAFWPWAYSS
jgi:NADH-quinone oxidoreductase subunit A